MNETEKQFNETAKKLLKEFNESADLIDVRQLYKSNFEYIKNLTYIKERASIEGISLLDSNLTNKVIKNMMFLRLINNLISKGYISESDIED